MKQMWLGMWLDSMEPRDWLEVLIVIGALIGLLWKVSQWMARLEDSARQSRAQNLELVTRLEGVGRRLDKCIDDLTREVKELHVDVRKLTSDVNMLHNSVGAMREVLKDHEDRLRLVEQQRRLSKG